MKQKWKKLTSLAIAATLSCPVITAWAEETTNLAAGIVPTQSFSSTTTGTLSSVTDGVKEQGAGGTSWMVRADFHYTQNPALIFDLGTAATVSSFVVTGSTSYNGTDKSFALPTNYDILYSNNGTSWETAAEVRGNASYESVSEIPDITARYWKLFVQFQSKDSGEFARICEVEIFGIGSSAGGEEEKAVPEVSMTAEKAELKAGETIVVSAEASCEGSQITAVGFYDNGTKIADAVLDGGVWTKELKLSAGEHFITAKAITDEGSSAESESMRVRVHSDGYTNIALGKDTDAYHGSTSGSYPEALVDGKTDDANGIYKWTANAANAEGAWAEIDLASGFDNIFLVKSITVRSSYNDTSSTDVLTDFTLAWYDGKEWHETEPVTGAKNVYQYSFDTAVTATKVKLISNMTSGFRVRELEVEGKLYEAPVVIVTQPAGGSALVYEEKVTVTVKACDNGAGIEKVKLYLNTAETELTATAEGDNYTFEVTGLREGEKEIAVRAYDKNGIYGESEKITVSFYSSKGFIEDFKACGTIQELAALIDQNKMLLGLDEGADYTDLDTYGEFYEKILLDKESIASPGEVKTALENAMTMKKLNDASKDEIVAVIRTELGGIKLDEFDALPEEVKTAVTEQLEKIDFADAQQLEKELGIQAALQSIKLSAWTNIETLINKYHERLELDEYDTYKDFNLAKRVEEANKYIAGKKTDSRMNTKDGFNEIFTEAVEAGESYKASSGSSGGGGGGSSFASGTVTVQGNTTAANPIAEELDHYDDIDKTHENWAAVMFLTEKGVMQGDGDRTFAPERALKREEFARILVDAFFEADETAETTFADVKETDWFYPYVATGQQLGLIAGINTYWFGSGEYVTREQMAALVYRAALKSGKTFTEEGESIVPEDEEYISSWAYYPIRVLRLNGVFRDGTLRPQDAATRAEAAQLLYEIMR